MNTTAAPDALITLVDTLQSQMRSAGLHAGDALVVSPDSSGSLRPERLVDRSGNTLDTADAFTGEWPAGLTSAELIEAGFDSFDAESYRLRLTSDWPSSRLAEAARGADEMWDIWGTTLDIAGEREYSDAEAVAAIRYVLAMRINDAEVYSACVDFAHGAEFDTEEIGAELARMFRWNPNNPVYSALVTFFTQGL
ncbi:hypothetical protein [Pseudoclavibacter soli]|uniref:hypothetical protein n=1 Tax=Pseudoclavibacter soli TaxID=452623 RepID=UPI00040141E6|nr:hypothetical protein [Pseudoclavibacter soli]